MRIALCLVAGLIFFGCASKEKTYIQNGEKVAVTPTKTKGDVKYYEDKDGRKVGVKDTILVKFHDTKNLQNYIKEYNLSELKNYGSGIYLFRVADSQDMFELSDILQQKSDIKYAHPNFYRQIKKK